MCGKNLAFWYCMFFFLVPMSSKTQQNFTGNEEKNDHLTIRCEIDAGSTTNYGDEMKTQLFDLYEKTINNTQYEDVQYEYRIVSTSNDNENDDWKPFISIQEFYENIMETENTSLKHEFENSSKDSNTSYIIPYESCINITYIQLCCPLGYRLDNDECISTKTKYLFPNVYEYINDSLEIMNKTMDELFSLAVPDNLCQNNYSDNYSNDLCILDNLFWFDYENYTFLANGSLYLSYLKIIVNSTSYCLVADNDKYKVAVCRDTFYDIKYETSYKHIYNYVYNYVKENKIICVSYYIISIPFLVSIFVVYSILPELRNKHGFMLRNYSGALSVAYIIDFIPFLIKANDVGPLVCFIIVFFDYFFLLASFFWLNMMSFDMWWTFRGFCALQRNIRPRKKNKLLFYSIFAWALSFILAIISFFDFGLKNDMPTFVIQDCRVAGAVMFTSYYYGFQSICIISSICLSISTALKIARYEKGIDYRLTNWENKRYNNNKKWSNLYRKLFILQFILMGIKWSMMTILLFKQLFPKQLLSKNIVYFINVIVLMDIMQNICTFIVFVSKKRLIRMLLKRFCDLFRCTTNATSPRTEPTCTTTLEEMPMRKRMSSCKQRICYKKDS